MGIRETGGPPSREYRPPPQIEPDVFPDLTRPEPDVGAERVEPASERPKLAIDMVDLEAPTADGGQAEGPAEATYLLGPIVEGAEQSDEVGQGDELNEELVPRAGIERAEPGQGDEVNDERDRGGRVRTLGIVGASPSNTEWTDFNAAMILACSLPIFEFQAGGVHADERPLFPPLLRDLQPQPLMAPTPSLPLSI